MKQIKKLIEKYNEKIKKAIILDLEKEGKKDNIEIIPIWKFLLNK